MRFLSLLQRRLVFNNIFSSRLYCGVNHKYVNWAEPEGFDSGITVYNTSNRKKVKFKTKLKGIVSWYACGPTVYDSAHIGHAWFGFL